MNVHGIREVQPQTFVSRVTKEFLEAQKDEWLVKLYEYLGGQSYVLRIFSNLNRPWVRLENGTYIAAYTGDQPNVFLPSKSSSGFATVCTAVCASDEALNFLTGTLKLTKPDPVDDVIKNILPLYESGALHDDLELYRKHLKSIESAYENRNTREKLVSALRVESWVPSIDNEGNKSWLTPYSCYLPTERLKQLFEGVAHVNFVDDGVAGLQGENMRNILIACGSERYLDTVTPRISLSVEERLMLRQNWGDTGCSGNQSEDDRTLHGLEGILTRMAELPVKEAYARCELLWNALADVVQDKREGVVKATYSWFYYAQRSISFDAAFIRILKKANWIPDADGRLATPEDIVFEQIKPAWATNAVLQSALNFRPSEVDQLAKALGLEPGMLNLLKRSGITSEAELKQRLGIVNAKAEEDNYKPIDEDLSQEEAVSGSRHADDGENAKNSDKRGTVGGDRRSTGESSQSDRDGSLSEASDKIEQISRREFVSYLAVNPIDDEDVSDSENHEERMRVESIAIDYILRLEPDLQRTSVGNAGFDLCGIDGDGHYVRWIEVKAMVGTLANRPVGMSKKQFETAQEKKTRFWLYIVENTTSEEPRILKIQNPAGITRTFTFDKGWSDIAVVSQVNIETGEIKA